MKRFGEFGRQPCFQGFLSHFSLCYPSVGGRKERRDSYVAIKGGLLLL